MRIFWTIYFAMCWVSCKKDPVSWAQVNLEFTPVVGTELLQLREGTYVNGWGEAFSVHTFKFYVAHWELYGEAVVGGAVSSGYALIDAANPASMKIQFSIPPGRYAGLRFQLGVDSVRNVSGAQTGALDVLHGMFWSWNSGYIMAKLEGVSPVAQTSGNAFTYHIGGFRQHQNTVHTITLPFTHVIDMQAGAQWKLNVQTDIQHWFEPHPIRIQQLPTVHIPGSEAVGVAQNYKDMFSWREVRTP
jgi:hypothetical protein